MPVFRDVRIGEISESDFPQLMGQFLRSADDLRRALRYQKYEFGPCLSFADGRLQPSAPGFCAHRSLFSNNIGSNATRARRPVCASAARTTATGGTTWTCNPRSVLLLKNAVPERLPVRLPGRRSVLLQGRRDAGGFRVHAARTQPERRRHTVGQRPYVLVAQDAGHAQPNRSLFFFLQPEETGPVPLLRRIVRQNDTTDAEMANQVRQALPGDTWEALSWLYGDDHGAFGSNPKPKKHPVHATQPSQERYIRLLTARDEEDPHPEDPLWHVFGARTLFCGDQVCVCVCVSPHKHRPGGTRDSGVRSCFEAFLSPVSTSFDDDDDDTGLLHWQPYGEGKCATVLWLDDADTTTHEQVAARHPAE